MQFCVDVILDCEKPQITSNLAVYNIFSYDKM